MPLSNLHLTVLELCYCRTPLEVETMIDALGPEAYTAMANYTLNHRARLIKPTLSYDAAAIALSFLPASGESLLPSSQTTKSMRTKGHDDYTYHHLRRDIFGLVRQTGVQVDSRYVVSSSHITIGRFLTQDDHDTSEKRSSWIRKIEELNEWLEEEFWPKEGRGRDVNAEWLVGMDKGLDFRKGTLWYGGGETVCLGDGFDGDVM
jgi:hypothetical protein